MEQPRILITGASGFLGRHLLDEIKHDYRIVGLARRSQARSGAPLHRNITWLQVDIRQREAVARAFREVAALGGVDLVVHLAAYYDFTGERHPDYRRTNVQGLRHVLDECRRLAPRRFIFASSAAACDFSSCDRLIDESTTPDGIHHYAESKRLGETMLAEYRDCFPSAIVRFAALFSDWCEYPPLFIFLGSWLSSSWRRRMVGGRGRFAIPYLHVRDGVKVLQRAIDRAAGLEDGEVLLACRDGAVPLRALFEEATLYYFGHPQTVLSVPRELCRLGMHGRDWLGRLIGHRPFERPWMATYIDRQLRADTIRTRRRLDWSPRERLSLLRRLPFLIQNYKSHPVEWFRRNHAAMRIEPQTLQWSLHRLLEKHEGQIILEMLTRMTGREGRSRFTSYQRLSDDEREWNHRVALRHLMDAIRTGDKSLYSTFCRDLAELRHAQGFEPSEVCAALGLLRNVCLEVLREDPEAAALGEEAERHLSMTLTIGCDQVEDTFERLEEEGGDRSRASLEDQSLAPTWVDVRD